MKKHEQQGELAITLSIIALIVTFIGVSVGSFSVKQSQLQSRTSSAEEIFTYKSTLEVRNEQGTVIPWEPGFTWDNGLDGTTEITHGDIKMPNKPEARLIYDATKAPGVPKILQGRWTTVTLKIPDQKWEIVQAFCTDVFGSSCSGTFVSEDKKIRSNMPINNGYEIVYGIIVKPRIIQSPTPSPTPSSTPTPTTIITPTATPTHTPTVTSTPTSTPRPTVTPTTTPRPTITTTPVLTVTPTPTQQPTSTPNPTGNPTPSPTTSPQSCPVAPQGCSPKNVQITAVASNSITVNWEMPIDCSGFNYLTDEVWLDVVHQGITGYIVCATSSHGTSATCQLGSPVPTGRLTNKDSTEYKTLTWNAMRSYRIDAFTFSAQGSCVSSPAQTTFVYDDLGLQKSALPKIQKKVMLVEYNIPLVSMNNKNIYDHSELPGVVQTRVEKLISEVTSSLSAYSGIEYHITKRVNVTNLGSLLETQNMSDVESLWLKCQFDNNFAACESMKQTYTYSYSQLDKMFDVCSMVNSNQIDEVWHVAYPGLSIGEDDMFGPKPFNINGKTAVLKKCKRNVPTLSIDLGRTSSKAIHSYLHRVESTIARVFQTISNDSNSPSAYSKFIAYPVHSARIAGNNPYPKAQQPYGCGIVHVPPYALEEYGYSTGQNVQSYCETFDTYPNFNVNNTSLVGNMLIEETFQHYFMAHVPRNPGRDATGRLNNWWEYVAYPEKVIQDSNSSSPYLSDVNSDDEVNAMDLSLLLSTLGTEVEPSDEARYNDINHDGMVNGADLTELYENYGLSIDSTIITHPNE